MLSKIIEFSIKNKLIIGLATFFLIGYGIYELQKLPIDAVPDITNNQVQVITVAPALGATDIERLITFPIEQANSNLPGLKELRSYSSFGLSVITIVFEDGMDVYWARQQISERLQQVQAELPAGLATPTLAPVSTGLGEIYQYTVRPLPGYEHKYNAMELRTIQDWIVRRQLLSVKGVAEVSSFGGLLKQYEIAVDPNKLLAHNITISDVFDALENNNQNTGGAYIEKGPTALFIRSEGLVNSLDDISNIIITRNLDGVPLLIKDVAQINFGHATRYGALTYNGELQVSGAIVLMLKGANSNEVIKDIKEKVEQIKSTLPEGVTIEPFIDRTKMVDNAIHTVIKNLLEGALIVIFVLVLFLGNLRAGFIVASVIPLSMLFAIILMNMFGVSGNLMSLGALDFGLIVDGAVIIVEAVLHKLSNHKHVGILHKHSQKQMDDNVQESASRMMNSAVFGQIVILIVYLPILSLQGIEGKMFKPMAQTVAFALIGAFILSLTYIPMMSSLFLSKKMNSSPTFSDKIMAKLEMSYKNALSKTFHHMSKVIAFVGILFIIALFTLSRMGGEFIPSLPEGDFAVETRVLPGSNLNTSIDAISKASKILLTEFPEVKQVVTKTGTSEVPAEPLPIDVSDMIIVLKDRKEWTSASSYSELEEKMSNALKSIPGVTFSFQYPVSMRFNELISGARQDVVCKIYGENLDTLSKYAQILGHICQSIDGSANVYVEALSGMPQIVIRYNRDAIARHGLSIAEINNVVNTAFAGQSSGIVYEGEKRFDLVVRLKQNLRKDLSDVQNLLIRTPSGVQIPLNHVASVQLEDGPNQIQRENSQRRIIVGFNVRGRDVQNTVNDLQNMVQEKIKLPAGYTIHYGGAFENLQAAKSRLYIAVPLSLALIFLLLYFAFGSIKQGLLIYTAIPLSAIGGIFALFARQLPFSISAGVGFIALFGVAVLNGIVLIAEFNRLKAAGHTNLLKITLLGTSTRLRPVLMTAFVASLGFLPMALSNGEGAEVQRPLATVVIGGLLVATFLTLFLLPILYYLTHKIKVKKINIKPVSILIILLTSVHLHAQNDITLQKAIETATQNNLVLKNEKVRIQLQEKLLKSGADLPKTQIEAQYGQFNSFYKDIGIGISQNFEFPTVYVRQKQLLKENLMESLNNFNLQELQLKTSVSELYSQLIYLKLKKELLKQNDSLLTVFLNINTLRFNSGESTILEKATAENQKNLISIQLKQLELDLELTLIQFQYLLNIESDFNPIETKIQLYKLAPKDSINLMSHPLLIQYEQQKKIAEVQTKLERARLLPDITASYNLVGIRGMGADNISYDGTPRFHSGRLGVGVPIIAASQKAKINAAKSQEILVGNNYEIELIKLKNNFIIAQASFENYNSQLDNYENATLPNADLIANTAIIQFKNGEISYLEWYILMTQVITLKNDYIELLKKRNDSLIQLYTFTNP